MAQQAPSRIEVDYLIETAFDPCPAAEAMAGEQSSGTFVPIPGATAELKQRSAARVEAMEMRGTASWQHETGRTVDEAIAALGRGRMH